MFFRRAVFIAAMTVCAYALFAQTGVSLEAEIQNMERAISTQGVTAQQRHDALVRLARLRQLSGDIEGAARNWLEAAAAVPGNVDDDALLACAYCLAAMGEWERAAAALEPLLPKSSRARFLNLSIYAIKTGDVSPLAAIADSGEYSQMKSEIYFMLWKTSRTEAAETWRRRLADEFPQSPEGRLAAGENPSAVVMHPSPFWLFLSGLDSLPLMESEQVEIRPVPTTAEKPAPETAAPPAAVQVVASKPPVLQPETQAAARLQTGLFSRQVNANTQIAGLRQAGFSPSLEQRGEMWVVTVPSGADQSRTIRELKTAGFDSFPVRQ